MTNLNQILLTALSILYLGIAAVLWSAGGIAFSAQENWIVALISIFTSLAAIVAVFKPRPGGRGLVICAMAFAAFFMADITSSQSISSVLLALLVSTIPLIAGVARLRSSQP